MYLEERIVYLVDMKHRFWLKFNYLLINTYRIFF